MYKTYTNEVHQCGNKYNISHVVCFCAKKKVAYPIEAVCTVRATMLRFFKVDGLCSGTLTGCPSERWLRETTNTHMYLFAVCVWEKGREGERDEERGRERRSEGGRNEEGRSEEGRTLYVYFVHMTASSMRWWPGDAAISWCWSIHTYTDQNV